MKLQWKRGENKGPRVPAIPNSYLQREIVVADATEKNVGGASMKVRKMKDTPERQRFWQYVEKSAREVRSWPKWMRGGDSLRTTTSPRQDVACDPHQTDG